jgi:hypothetical protein
MMLTHDVVADDATAGKIDDQILSAGLLLQQQSRML